MNDSSPALADRYTAALREYLLGNDERFLEQAYVLGREAVEEQHGILDLMWLHQRALETLVHDKSIPDKEIGHAAGDLDFLREALAPFEMTQSGYVSALEKLRSLNESLERQVEDRTAALRTEIAERTRIEVELRNTLSQLTLSNTELLDFANAASHDLQEPLRKIQTFGDRLRQKLEQSVDSQAADYLRRMQNAAGRMQDLIDSLISFSRVTASANRFVSTNLNELVRDTLGDLELLIEQNAGHVEVGVLPVVKCDPSQMQRLLQNLIVNALTFYAPGSSPVATISGTESDDFYEIVVADKGIGFDEKYLDRIFTPFQRLNTQEKYSGTGMGLAIVRKIAQQHGGNVVARSRPSQPEGSTFIVRLPKRP